MGAVTVHNPLRPASQSNQDWHGSAARAGLTIFFVSGMLMSFLGAVLPAWGYHLRDNHIEVGWYFLALGAGLVVPTRAAASSCPIAISGSQLRPDAR